MADDAKLCRLYRLLIQKYAVLINEKERRTIGQVKELLDSNDLTIQFILPQLKPPFKPNYTFETDYPQAASNALSFVSNQIDFVKLDIPISFWLSPKEIMEHKIADDEDQAVFLCTLLLALGDTRAEVIIAEMDDLSTHAFVITELQGEFHLLDSTKKNAVPLHGKKETVLANYSFANTKIKRFLYKFNRSNYEQFL